MPCAHMLSRYLYMIKFEIEKEPGAVEARLVAATAKARGASHHEYDFALKK